MLADRVLLGGEWSDDSLGTCRHRDQHSDCPASMPNLARPQGLCPGTTLGLAVWGPMLTRKCCSAKGLDISSLQGRDVSLQVKHSSLLMVARQGTHSGGLYTQDIE